MKGRIHSVESFGTVDGPGIRYVVFFRGCPMRCRYCHNPDTWAVDSGSEYSAEELIAKLLRNREFYKSGGITASGGEPMLQLDFLIELFRLAKKNKIHTCLDTSGITFDPDDAGRVEKIDEMLSLCDLVMLDIKHIDEGAHKDLTGHSNSRVLAFAGHLARRNIKMRVRHVLIPGITDSEEQLCRLGERLRKFRNIERVEVLPYHTLGKVKYESLGLEYPLGGVREATADEAKRALGIIEKARLG